MNIFNGEILQYFHHKDFSEQKLNYMYTNSTLFLNYNFVFVVAYNN